MIAECPHCAADISVDANQESNILTCPSCHQQCAFERPPGSATTATSETSGGPQTISKVVPLFERPYHPGWRLFLALLLLGGFIAGALMLEPWLDDNPAMAEEITPAGRFYIVAIHFPIALVSILFLSEILLLFRSRARFRPGIRYWWWWAAFSGGVALLLSLLLARDPDVTFNGDLADTHDTFALAMTGVLFVTLMVKIFTDGKPGRSKLLYRLFVLASTAIVLWTGYLGLGMVLGKDYLLPDLAIEQSATEPDEDDAMEPVEDGIPEPVEEDIPDPVEEDIPEPVEENIPEPVEEDIPEPIEEDAVEPVEENAVEPVEEDPSDPVEENDSESIDDDPGQL